MERKQRKDVLVELLFKDEEQIKFTCNMFAE